MVPWLAEFRRSGPQDRQIFVLTTGVCGACLAAALWLIFQGYGADNDIFLMLASWQTALLEGRYAASRFQGSPVAELLLGWSAGLAGSLGSNIISLLAALGGLIAFGRILISSGVSAAWTMMAVAIVASNPHWLLAATTSMDYSLGLGLMLIALALSRERLWIWAALAFALATGCRTSIAAIALGVMLGGWYCAARADRHRIVEALVVFLAITALLYVPVWISAKLTFDFIGLATPDGQGLIGLIARFGYKGLELYGLPATLLLIVVIGAALKKFRPAAQDPRTRPLLAVSLGIIALHLVLFLRAPIEVAYLLPILPAIAAALVVIKPPLPLLALLIALQAVHAVAQIDLLDIDRQYEGDPCAPVLATDARLAPSIADGVILDDLERRDPAWYCATREGGWLSIAPDSPWHRLPP